MRRLIGLTGIVLLVFGLACLNYTKASGLEHHRAFAREHHLPEPGNGILLGGVVAVSLGSALVGYVVGSRANSST
jgi:hypothetical protein